MTMSRIQRTDIPLATRLEYEAKNTIIIGGTMKKNIFETWRNQIDRFDQLQLQIFSKKQTDRAMASKLQLIMQSYPMRMKLSCYLSSKYLEY